MELLTATGAPLDDDALVALRRAPSADLMPGPWVRAVFVSSLDGASSLDGVSAGLGSPADARQFALARTDADVILVGAGTVRAEGYAGPLVDDAARARRRAAGLAEHPHVAVVTGRLDLDPDGEFLAQAPVRPWILTTERAVSQNAGRAAALGERADVVPVGDDAVDPRALLAALTERGARVVHCEGGPSLFGTLAGAGLVDELLLTLSAVLAGGSADRILTAGPGAGLPSRLRLHHVLAEDDDLFLRYVHERHAAVPAPAVGAAPA